MCSIQSGHSPPVPLHEEAGASCGSSPRQPEGQCCTSPRPMPSSWARQPAISREGAAASSPQRIATYTTPAPPCRNRPRSNSHAASSSSRSPTPRISLAPPPSSWRYAYHFATGAPSIPRNAPAPHVPLRVTFRSRPHLPPKHHRETTMCSGCTPAFHGGVSH